MIVLNLCLVVVFNHRFETNLPKLRALYHGRFEHIRYLMPFYRGTDPDVVPVFESSATFQGYFAQAARQLISDHFSHYLFVADDLLLDPEINEQNIFSRMRLEQGTGYIKNIQPLSSLSLRWTYFYKTLKALRFDNFVNAKAELPDRQEALDRLNRHHLHFQRLGWRNLATGAGSVTQRMRTLVAGMSLLYGRKGARDLIYPLAMGYADLLVVPAEAMAEFCHLCGVFAAMDLFVECAAPTALALTVSDLRQEQDLATRGVELWTGPEQMVFGERYSFQLPKLLGDFPAGALYVHPIKFSRWRSS